MICILPLITTFKNCYAIKFKHWHKHINKQLTGIRRKCLKNKSSFLMLLWIVYFVDIWMRVHACRGGHSQLVDLDIIPREWPLLCGVLWAYSSHICVHIFVTCFWVCKCEWNLLLIYLYLFFFWRMFGWLITWLHANNDLVFYGNRLQILSSACISWASWTSSGSAPCI